MLTDVNRQSLFVVGLSYRFSLTDRASYLCLANFLLKMISKQCWPRLFSMDVRIQTSFDTCLCCMLIINLA
jgi:hypothetical protein